LFFILDVEAKLKDWIFGRRVFSSVML
jgi:hypothetical protein